MFSRRSTCVCTGAGATARGPVGPPGPRGPTGPAGSNVLAGTIVGQYLRWADSDVWSPAGATIAVGEYAGETEQGIQSVAVGPQAGRSSQGQGAVAVGTLAGSDTQGANAVAVGLNAGSDTQATEAVAVGCYAGQTTQALGAVAIGTGAGFTQQGTKAVGIGALAGESKQGEYALAIGADAGKTDQGDAAVAIGPLCGATSQGNNAVAIGSSSGATSQGVNAIAIGIDAGSLNQGTGAVAIGNGAGSQNQGTYAIAIGDNCSIDAQADNSVAIGYQTACGDACDYAVAIGPRANAGGSYAIVLGGTVEGSTSGADGCIVLNASGASFTAAEPAGCYVQPVRSISLLQQPLQYDAATSEITRCAAPSVALAALSAPVPVTAPDFVQIDGVTATVNAVAPLRIAVVTLTAQVLSDGVMVYVSFGATDGSAVPVVLASPTQSTSLILSGASATCASAVFSFSLGDSPVTPITFAPFVSTSNMAVTLAAMQLLVQLY